MNKKVRNAIFALLVACMLCVPLGVSWGDAGGFAGSSGYSSSGGSSSGGSSSGGGSSSSSGGGMYYLGPGGSGDDDGSDYGAAIIFGVVFALIVISAILSKRNAGSGGAGGAASKGKGAGQVHIQDTFDESRVQPLSSLQQKDAAFDAQDIEEDIANWYVRMQNAWTAGDFTPMQPYFSDALYAQFTRQLEQIKSAGQTNHIDNIAVLGVNVQGWYEQDGQDFLVARVQTRIIDYYTDDKTGEVVSGSKTIEKFMTYRYILSRTSVQTAPKETSAETTSAQPAENNAATSANVAEAAENAGGAGTAKAESAVGAGATKAAPQTRTINCPNCGAAVDVNKSAKCPYCDSILNASTHDWVISAIQGLEQRNAS